jgi:hypothetical protein
MSNEQEMIRPIMLAELEIPRDPVDSSVIASMGYIAEHYTLQIEFRSGEIYNYFDVPMEEFAAFRSADSKGTYLNQVFKLRGYRYIRIR